MSLVNYDPDCPCPTTLPTRYPAARQIHMSRRTVPNERAENKVNPTHVRYHMARPVPRTRLAWVSSGHHVATPMRGVSTLTGVLQHFRDPNSVSSRGGGAWPRYSASSGRKYLNFRPDRTVAVVSAAPAARSACAFWNSLVPQMEEAAKKTCEERQLFRIAEESKFLPLRKR